MPRSTPSAPWPARLPERNGDGPFPLVLVAAALAGAVAGALAGLPSLRVRGLYFVLSTLALHFIVVFLMAEYQYKFFDVVGIPFNEASRGHDRPGHAHALVFLPAAAGRGGVPGPAQHPALARRPGADGDARPRAGGDIRRRRRADPAPEGLRLQLRHRGHGRGALCLLPDQRHGRVLQHQFRDPVHRDDHHRRHGFASRVRSWGR